MTFRTVAVSLVGIAISATAADLPIANYSLENGQSGFTTYHDDTYNGSGNPNADGVFLSGGLGQLADGVLGTNDIFDNGVFDWVGWFSIQPTITFDLGTLSVLDTLSFRSANESSAFNDVAVFGSANVSFSPDGLVWSAPFTHTTSAADRTGDESRWVDIPLNSQSARYVRVQLFDGEKVGEGSKPWIFISEAKIVGVPEPTGGALALLGLAVALARRSGVSGSKAKARRA